MNFIAGSSAAALIALMALYMPRTDVLPFPWSIDIGSASWVCSASAIVDMSIFSTPSRGMTGCVLPIAASAPIMANIMKKDTMPKMKSPARVARVILMKSFIKISL